MAVKDWNSAEQYKAGPLLLGYKRAPSLGEVLKELEKRCRKHAGCWLPASSALGVARCYLALPAQRGRLAAYVAYLACSRWRWCPWRSWHRTQVGARGCRAALSPALRFATA